MKSLILILGISFFALSSSAQDSSRVKKQQPNLATIQTMDGKKIKGWFYQASDESILLLPLRTRTFSRKSFESLEKEGRITEVSLNNISSIGLRKKNSILKGALIGLGVGVVSGIIIGYASGDDPIEPLTGNPFEDIIIGINNSFAMTAGEKAISGAFAIGSLGTITGAVIGMVAKKKFTINGKKENYHDKEVELMKRLLIK